MHEGQQVAKGLAREAEVTVDQADVARHEGFVERRPAAVLPGAQVACVGPRHVVAEPALRRGVEIGSRPRLEDGEKACPLRARRLASQPWQIGLVE